MISQESSRRHRLNIILRTPTMLSILFTCIVISIILVGYSTFYIIPVFSNLLLQNIEKEAERTAEYLSAVLLAPEPDDNMKRDIWRNMAQSRPPMIFLSEELFTNKITERIKEAQYYFRLKKLKFFDSRGKIVYSTDGKNVGHVNTKPYFLNQVAKGENYTKVVREHSYSAESVVQNTDVAEIYIPLMNQADFMGALEIYYDISERKQALELLVTKTLSVICGMTILFLLSVGYFLNKAGENMIRREKAEQDLMDTNSTLEKRVAAQTEEIRQTQKISVKALATLAEHYDSDTGEHLNRIQSYVEILANWLKKQSHFQSYISKKPDYIDELKLASLLHDGGKTAVPIEILTKPGKLTGAEFDIIRTHTIIAGEALTLANEDFKSVFCSDSYLALARDIALYHHERWDGTGYPKGLCGEEIPLSARIVAVADVYDALTTKRPYKEPWTHMQAVDEIVGKQGLHFDPEVIKGFISEADKFQAVATCNEKEKTPG